jgi:hypothetical protein
VNRNSQAFWRGHGLWRIPNFFRSVAIDARQWGIATAAQVHYRRLTINDAARKLAPISGAREGGALGVWFMSGLDHWGMTALCAYSLFSNTRANLIPIIIDDGKLDETSRGELVRILPQAQFVDRETSENQVQRSLPERHFPTLHAMRRELPLMRKLLDLHAGQSGWRLFLDSDMLFFREPRWMLNWLCRPDRPVYMWDHENSYGYSPALLDKIFGQTMPHFVNTGFCGMQSESIDWDRLEYWARLLHAAEGTNHFSEQCLTAMMMTLNGGSAAPREYLIYPSEAESRKPTAVMHHYVAESRTWYHIHGWPQLIANPTGKDV